MRLTSIRGCVIIKGKGCGGLMRKTSIFSVLFFVCIPIGLLILFTYIPFINVIIDSFYKKSYTSDYGYVGLDNYITVINNPDYKAAFGNSIYYITAAFIQDGLAFVLALFLCNKRFSGFFKALITLPYMINGMAIGYIFKLFYTHGYVLDSILGRLGFEVNSLPYWLRDQSINNWALAFASVWRYTGLSLVVFIGAIGSIDRSIFEAASIDGANDLALFKHIIWPNIKKVVLLDLFLSVVSSLSEYELPYAIASGGANGTATYMTYIYKLAFNDRKIGLASAMAVILLLQIALVILAVLMSVKIAIKVFSHGDDGYE